ncbi:MAG TPA: hypothetical protein PKD85_02150 [Saprospiraceae bacterium]|nr:hypothetical protein [Saprospiraceae bacterium]
MLNKFLKDFLEEVYPSNKLPEWIDQNMFYKKKSEEVKTALLKYKDNPQKEFLDYLGPTFFISCFSPCLDVVTNLTDDMKNYVIIVNTKIPTVKELKNEGIEKTNVKKVKIEKEDGQKFSLFLQNYFGAIKKGNSTKIQKIQKEWQHFFANLDNKKIKVVNDPKKLKEAKRQELVILVNLAACIFTCEVKPSGNYSSEKSRLFDLQKIRDKIKKTGGTRMTEDEMIKFILDVLNLYETLDDTEDYAPYDILEMLAKCGYNDIIRKHFEEELKMALTTGRSDNGLRPLKKSEISAFMKKYHTEIEKRIDTMYNAYQEDNDLESLATGENDWFREYLFDDEHPRLYKAIYSSKL